MASASRTMHPWNTLEYQRMVSAVYSDGQVVIRFADGSRVELSPGSLVSAGAQEPDWHRVRAEEYHLTVPSNRGN